jgi:hypothetical protein
MSNVIDVNVAELILMNDLSAAEMLLIYCIYEQTFIGLHSYLSFSSLSLILVRLHFHTYQPFTATMISAHFQMALFGSLRSLLTTLFSFFCC